MAANGTRKRQRRRKLVRWGPVDNHVDGRVRLRRRMLGISQQKLAGSLGVTFQQLQKNERGTNRIASSRLFDLSRALGVPVQFFFDEMPAKVATSVRQHDHAIKGAAHVGSR